MKGLVKLVHGEKNTELKEVEKPKIQSGKVLIKVKASGICGTDLKFYYTEEGNTKLSPPVILGHEGSGVVVEVAEDVNDIKVGDRVVSETNYSYCGKCHYCNSGNINMCINGRKGLGSTANGFFAEYVLCNSKRIYKLPEEFSFQEAALIEPLSCCVNAVVETSSIKPGNICIVFGAGLIGNFTAQLAYAIGAKVVLVGTRNSIDRLKLANKIGIEETLVFGQDDIEGYIENISEGYGADIVFECSGSDKALATGLNVVKKMGEIILLSAPNEMNLDLWNQIVLKGIKMIGVISSRPSCWETAMKLLKNKKINVKKLISYTYPLSNWEEAFKKAKFGKSLKVILEPNQ
ncbi:zinc-dependent alcohol dehydrogenase [Clostridium oceanicum]|uniref:Zinc-binding dehydrogenase n=1 Tax=Clostridium oceanicum TaxID=1543 RepID=A0ABP3UHW5_9CLOT